MADADGHTFGPWDMLQLRLLLLHHPTLRFLRMHSTAPFAILIHRLAGSTGEGSGEAHQDPFEASNFCAAGLFYVSTYGGLAAETRFECRGGERPPSLAPKQIPNISSAVGILPSTSFRTSPEPLEERLV